MRHDKIDRSPRGVAARNGLSYNTIYKEIKAGRIKAKKLGIRTLITAEAEQAWLDSLPDVEVDEHGRLSGNGYNNLSKAG